MQKNIKAILFDKKEKDNIIVEKFLRLQDTEILSFTDEDELTFQIDVVKKKYASKEVIILKPFMGRFFQMCPGSPNVICCNYRVINTCFNCFYDCTYCFLNTYLNSFGVFQFTNIENLHKEIDQFLNGASPELVYRVGSGEFTDSLMMDNITGIGESLIEKFSPYKNMMLELKTKSGNVDHLLDIKDKGSTVLAWSLNTERNIAMYEKGSASLIKRIDAAKKAGEAGFYLAFHFDPIIIYDGWENEYGDLIQKLFSKINAEKVVWISLGCFRYAPGFKDILRDKFPDEMLTIEEMFPGVDGKYRYFKNKRIKIYATIRDYLKTYSQKPFIYLCMETGNVWHSVFNKYYDSSDRLEKDFSEYLKNAFLK